MPQTPSLVDRVRELVAELRRRDVDFALIGGFAVSARAEPLFTRDVDLAVAVADDKAAERLINALFAGGYRLDAGVEHEDRKRLATAHLFSPGPAPARVDLCFASSGIEAEVVAMATEIQAFPRLRLPVACVGHLIALKVLSNTATRPQDAMDLKALLSVASAADLSTARAACRLITSRGYNRGRHLAHLLKQALQDPEISRGGPER